MEKNRSRFQIDDSELKARRQFYTASRKRLKDIKQNLQAKQNRTRVDRDREGLMSNGAGTAGAQGDRYDKYQNAVQNENSAFLANQEQVQQQIVADQDQELEVLGSAVTEIRGIAGAMGQELEEQKGILDDYHVAVDRLTGRLQTANRKVRSLLEKTGGECVLVSRIRFVSFWS